jgi:hypothetical protein
LRNQQNPLSMEGAAPHAQEPSPALTQASGDAALRNLKRQHAFAITRHVLLTRP